MSIRRADGAHAFGYTAIAGMDGANADILMDFGILRMRAGEVHEEPVDVERAFLLVYGHVVFQWAGEEAEVSRRNCFDDSPIALHVPPGVPVTIRGVGADSEIAVLRTDNERTFASRLYRPEDTPDERRGAGLMQETSTRIVRTIFDHSTAPDANLVLGEVIGLPGKWSSYPPHHHPQPEIYYYKTQPEHGFAYAELGEDVLKVHHNDTVCIAPGLTHPHSTAPGYALWYFWGIRHLPGQPYITPTFVPEHLWVQENGAVYWPEQPAGEGNA